MNDSALEPNGVCRSCGAPIVWAKTERGRNMPLNPDPHHGDSPSGLFVVHGGVALAVPPDAFPGEANYISHFATCEHADEHRR